MKARSILVVLLSLSLFGGFFLSIGADESLAKDTKIVSLATGGVGGIWYSIGGGMAELINKNVPGVKSSAQSTGASVENLRLLNSKEVDFGMWGAATAWKSKSGQEPFTESIKNPRSIGLMFSAVFQFVIKQKHGVTTFSGLKGKRISAGGIGSGTWANALLVLPELGIDKENMVAIGYRAANDAFKDNRIDAMLQLGGYPFPNLTELATTEKVVFLSMTKKDQQRLTAKYPHYMKYTLPPGTYNGQNSPVLTLSDPCIIGTRNDIPDDLVYKITKVFYSQEGLAYLQKVHSVVKQVNLETALAWSMTKQMYPIHPGAIKYYKELAKQLGKEWKSAE